MLVLYGGSGFIGRHISESSIRHNIKTGVISRSCKSQYLNKSESLTTAQVGTPKAELLLKKATTIVYLANSSRPSSRFETMSEMMSKELKTLTNFMEELQNINPECNFIYLSSGGQVYGPNHRNIISEKNNTNPVTPYALSKCLNENVLQYFMHRHAGSIIVLRLANPVGHWQYGTSHGLVTTAITTALINETLTIYGDGNNVRDYFDVDDFSDFICTLHHFENTPSGTFNIGSNTGNTELDIISAVENNLNISLEVNFVSIRNFDFRYAVLDSSKAQKELGWKSLLTIDQTIQKVKDKVYLKINN